MAHSLPLPMPCPVPLGTFKNDSLEAQLHEYVKQGNYLKVKKILKRGISVDTSNSLGQTALFTAALLGLRKLVDVLLDYGSDPNHRCYDGSTPVHAAAFSGDQWILSKLLDAGGDLRIHDKNGRNPQCWAMSAGKESSAQMLQFIQRCASHMQAAIQNYPSDLLRKVDSSKVLVVNPSRFGGITHGKADNPLSRLLKGGANSSRNIYSFGFGKFYLTGSRQLGYLASLPIIGDKEVVQADNEPTFSFQTGPYMIMRNLMWGSSRVTVKEFSLKPHHNCSKLRLADLLIAEQEYSSKLRHPHLLQLMAVCLSSDLERTRLVYERVNFGSLYSILHERRSEFPVLHMETVVHLLLQVNDALRFLHSRGFIHRSLTSYAVHVVSAGEAKLTNLEYMIESKAGGDHSDLTHVPVPPQLYRWCSPEVVLEKAATVKSDIYSFCTVMQEVLTETLPWNELEGSGIKELVISGQHLKTDVRLPKLYYDIVKTGLEPKQKDRSTSLQDIRYILKNDLKDLIESRMGHFDESSAAQRHDVFPDLNIHLGSACNYKKGTVDLQGEKITESSGRFTAPECSVSPAEKEAIIDHEVMKLVTQNVSQDRASEVQRTYSVSDVDNSLCSFEINEIYTCYSELHEEVLEELAGLDHALEHEIKQKSVDVDRAVSQILPLLPEIQVMEQPNSSEESSSSEVGTDCDVEEIEGLSKASNSCMPCQLGADAKESVHSTSKTEQHISKCVLNLKISQTLLQQATDSLYRTESKLDKLETVQNELKLFKKIQTEQVSKQMSTASYLDKVDYILKNIKMPFSGYDAFWWKAVGPPSRNYIPPSLQVPGAQSTLNADHFQAISKAVKEPRAIQSEQIECFSERSQNKDDDWQSDFSSNTVKSIEAQVVPNYQQLHPCVAVKPKKKVNVQCHRGPSSNSEESGIEEETWFFPKSAHEIHNINLRREGRRMVQSEWTTEVKQMAKKVAAGQLRLLPPNPPSECTSESETESVKEAFLHGTTRDQECSGWHRKDDRWQIGNGTETQDLGPKEIDESEESDLESVLKSFAGRSWQCVTKDEHAQCRAAIPKNSVTPTKDEDPCCEQSREFAHSPSSSPDISDEFFTPDPDYIFSPATQQNSELETSSSEDELEVNKDCAHKLLSTDAGSGEKVVLCNSGVKSLISNEGGVNQLHHPPVASAETSQEMLHKETLKEFQEKDISLTDIQDLSSISCEQENICKEITCKTPRASHAPTNVSTPLSPGKKMPSTVKKYRDCRGIPLDTSCWAAQETSITVSSNINTAHEKERNLETLFFSSEAYFSGLTEPVRKESGNPSPATQQSDLRKAGSSPAFSQASDCFIDELPPPAQELLDEIENLKQQDATCQDLGEKGASSCNMPVNDPIQANPEDKEEEEETENNGEVDHSLWTKDILNLAEETERAHSTLDDLLERILQPISEDDEVKGEPRGCPVRLGDNGHFIHRATDLKDPEDDEMKSGTEDAGTRAEGRETETCAGNTEASNLEDQKPSLWQRLPWPSPFRVIVLDQSNAPK